MQAHKAHEATGPFHGLTPWSWLTIGVAVLIIAVALGVGFSTRLGETATDLTVPATPVKVEPPTKDVVLGRGSVGLVGASSFADGATGIRESGTHAAAPAVGAPDAATAAREGSGYATDFTDVAPGGRCPAIQRC